MASGDTIKKLARVYRGDESLGKVRSSDGRNIRRRDQGTWNFIVMKDVGPEQQQEMEQFLKKSGCSFVSGMPNVTKYYGSDIGDSPVVVGFSDERKFAKALEEASPAIRDVLEDGIVHVSKKGNNFTVSAQKAEAVDGTEKLLRDFAGRDTDAHDTDISRQGNRIEIKRPGKELRSFLLGVERGQTR